MNENLMRELMEVASNITKLETETHRAVSNIMEKVKEDRVVKQRRITKFLLETKKTLETCYGAESGEVFAIVCYGDVGIRFSNPCYLTVPHFSIAVESYISDTPFDYRIDDDGNWRENEKALTPNKTRACLIDHWTDETEKKIEAEVMSRCKKALEKRAKKAASKLQDANNKYELHFGKDGE